MKTNRLRNISDTIGTNTYEIYNVIWKYIMPMRHIKNLPYYI